MSPMRFPLLHGKRDHLPEKPVCPSCRRRRAFEPHSFAVLSAGALLKVSRSDAAAPDKRMLGFLGLTWHGAHDGGSGKARDVFVHVPVAEDVVGGQGELYFCSARCLRSFLTEVLREFERRIAAAVGRIKRRRKASRKAGRARSEGAV